MGVFSIIGKTFTRPFVKWHDEEIPINSFLGRVFYYIAVMLCTPMLLLGILIALFACLVALIGILIAIPFCFVAVCFR